jgi:hypothetical protein
MSELSQVPQAEDQMSEGSFMGAIVTGGVILAVLSVPSCMYVYPQYRVWEQGLVGEAELKRAEQNRRIKVQEAQAVLDSSKLLGDAEVMRSRGVAEANKIIGDSLKGNDGYLRYLWIQGLQTNQMQVIYVPTEANLPLMEATRLSHMFDVKEKGTK